MQQLLLVAVGGAIGASTRHGVNIAAGRLFGTGFPAGTLIVNVAGCLLMGLFIGLLALKWSGSEGLRLFVATGFLGGFTTFSAFSLDFVTLWERGETATALGYAAVSVVLSIAALWAGLALVRAVA